MVNFAKNIHYFRLRKGLNQQEIADSLGFSRTQWSNYESGTSYPKFLDFIKIARYFDIPEGDLIHFEFRENHVPEAHVSEKAVRYLKNYPLRTDHPVDHQVIPIYNLEATAGLVELFNDSNETQAIDTLSIPNLPKCDGALFVAGDSMHPLLKSGDIVIYKKVNDIKNDIFWGQMYLISISMDDEEFVMVKYIQKSELGEDHIKLVSENRHHQDKDICIDKVRALALIKASVRVNTMN